MVTHPHFAATADISSGSIVFGKWSNNTFSLSAWKTYKNVRKHLLGKLFDLLVQEVTNFSPLQDHFINDRNIISLVIGLQTCHLKIHDST